MRNATAHSICPPRSVLCCLSLKSNRVVSGQPAVLFNICGTICQQALSIYATRLHRNTLESQLQAMESIIYLLTHTHTHYRTHCTERIWIDHFKGSSRVCSIMWLLAANPALRVQALFPKSIHNLFCFLTNWLKCQKEGQRTRKAENLHVEEASVWYVPFMNYLKQLTELVNCHSANLPLLQG